VNGRPSETIHVNSGAQDLPTAYLERYPEAGGPAERTPVRRLPFVIGRSETADHTLYSSKVSKEHAVIEINGGRYALRDLRSTNGTFLNGQRTDESYLKDGDIIHLAHIEFCFRHTRETETATRESNRVVEQTQIIPADRPSSLIRGGELLRELLAAGAVETLFQPIVDLRTRTAVAFEALARGTHPELSNTPTALLALAEQCDLVVELSRLFAKRAVMQSTRLPTGAKVFVNVHPRELSHPDLLDALTELVAFRSPDHQIVLEIAESSVTDVSAMGKNREAFTSLGLQFAYDDFGAGQARLIELADIPPDYLKFDKSMIEGIEAATPRQEMVSALLRVVRRLGVRVIAEGVEAEAVASICQQLGCDLGQGFLFGRPG
jgi:EAL domain-containing protein (putative c-di-GMP-specific phosphodiesterase class I)